MAFLTDFADQAVTLPLAAAFALVLALSGWWRGCAAWVVAVGAVLGAMGLLKIVFLACTRLLGGTGIHSPSGHTAAAAVVLGGAAVLLLRGRVPAWVPLAIPPGLAATIGVTRLAVHAHTVPEVLAGGAVGLAGAAALVLLAGPRPPMRVWPGVLVCGAILLGFHGLRMPAEAALHRMTLWPWLPVPAACRA